MRTSNRPNRGRQEARSALLPDIEAQADETTAMKSLAALGLDLATNQTLTRAENGLTGLLAPVEKALLNDIIKDIPRVVGPFNSVDVRAKLTQSVFDFSNIRRYQASRAAVRAATRTIAATPTIPSRPRSPKRIWPRCAPMPMWKPIRPTWRWPKRF